MNQFSRRQLLQGACGLAVAGAGELLHPQARATPASGKLGGYADFLAQEVKRVADVKPMGSPPLKE